MRDPMVARVNYLHHLGSSSYEERARNRPVRLHRCSNCVDRTQRETCGFSPRMSAKPAENWSLRLENHPSQLRWSRSAVARASDLEAGCSCPAHSEHNARIVASEFSQRSKRHVFTHVCLDSSTPHRDSEAPAIFKGRWSKKLQYNREASCVTRNSLRMKTKSCYSCL